MQVFPLIITAVTALAGIYYLVNSSAARRLVEVEASHHNQQRIRLRRAGGILMIVLAVGFAMVFRLPVESPALPWVLLAVLMLVVVMLLLAMMDWRLTRRIRRRGIQRNV